MECDAHDSSGTAISNITAARTNHVDDAKVTVVTMPFQLLLT